MFSITSVIGDQRNDILHNYFIDSLAYYKANDQLVSYLSLLDKTHNLFLKKKEFNEIKSLLEYYELFRLPNTGEEMAKARYSFTLYAFTFYKKFEDHLTALKFYELAHDNLEDKLNGDKYSWYVENVIGNIYTRLEQYEKAEHYLNIVERYLKATGNNKDLSRLYINKSRALTAQQKTSKAISLLNKSRKFSSDDKVNASHFLNLADLYVLIGRLDSCKIYLDLYDELSASSKEEYLYYYFDILGDKCVAELEIDQGQKAYDQSYKFLIKKLDTSNSRLCAKLLNKKSKAYMNQDDFQNAQLMLVKGFKALIENYDSTSQTLPTIDQLYPENTFYELVFQYAILFFEKYKKDNLDSNLYVAQDAIELALEINRMLGYTYLTTPSKMLSINQNKKLVDLGLNILYELTEKEGPDKWVMKINEMFDFSKSLNLLDRMSKSNYMLSLEPHLRDSLNNIQKELLRLLSEKSKAISKLQRDSLSAQIFEIEKRMNSKFEDFKTIFNYPIDNLPPFIEYVVTSNAVFSINNLKGGFVFVKNGTVDELNFMHAEFNNFILDKASDSKDNILIKIYDFLIGDLELKHSNFVVVPDGKIATIPFEVLKGRSRKYLIEENAIFYALHKTQLNKKDRRRKFEKLFILKPNYGLDQFTSTNRGGTYNLQYSSQEVEHICNLFPDQAAPFESIINTDTIFSKLKDVNIFHYSGHAIAKGEDAFLILSDEESQVISYSEIADQNLTLEMVVLSACETGLGKLAYGDGLQSLARAFMQAGSKTVVNSLWTVNDKSTAEIVSHFYTYIKKGQSLDCALRQAKLQYINNTPLENQHPFYWAGLIGLGDLSPIVDQNPPMNILYGALVIFGLLFLLSAIYLKIKN